MKATREQHERMNVLRDLPEMPTYQERLETLDRERPLSTAKRQTGSGKTFLLVSGLPRSGTSLMMQMLVAGGIAAKTDGERVADVDNPQGYYEWEAIKKIAKQAGTARRGRTRRQGDQGDLDAA